MADQFDRAQELDARYRQQALADQARRSARSEVTRTHCLDCGDAIPEARRKARPGCIRCITCAEMFEADNRRG
ncbi:TraR/DksA C4-type zinc finger protein [Desulfocastanea catecholica]